MTFTLVFLLSRPGKTFLHVRTVNATYVILVSSLFGKSCLSIYLSTICYQMSVLPSVWGLFLPLWLCVCLHEPVCGFADCKYTTAHRFAWLRPGCSYVLMAADRELWVMFILHALCSDRQSDLWPHPPLTQHCHRHSWPLCLLESTYREEPVHCFPQTLGAASRSRPDQTPPCPSYLVSSECDLHFLLYNGAVSPKRQIRALWPGSDRQTGGRPAPEDHWLLCPVCTLGE